MKIRITRKGWWNLGQWACAAVLLVVACVWAGRMIERTYRSLKDYTVIDRVDRLVKDDAQVDGVVRILQGLRTDYERARSDADREDIRSMMLQRARDVDRQWLPDDLREFLRTLEHGVTADYGHVPQPEGSAAP